MNIVYFLKLYFSVLSALLLTDLLWLTKFAPSFYKTHIGHLMAAKPLLVPAGIFYAVFIIGLIVFSILPGIKTNSVITAVSLGALYGLCTYSTYDLTNYATLKDWPIIVVMVDLLWGTFLSTVVALVGYHIGIWLR